MFFIINVNITYVTASNFHIVSHHSVLIIFLLINDKRKKKRAQLTVCFLLLTA